MTAFNKRNDQTQNTKVLTDINTIKTSLISYKASESKPPLPAWNRNFFSETGTYVHMDKDATDEEMNKRAYGVYGSFTENLLANKYLNALPLDPRTNQYYAYGVKLSNGQFDLAGVIKSIDDEIYLTRTVYDYDGVWWIQSLIREYNWPRFVKDMSARLPYNPENRILVVTDQNWIVYRKWDSISSGEASLEIYFSDGSVSVLEPNTTIRFDELDFPKENLLASKVVVYLSKWAIWTKATQLWSDSNFIITNGDINAAVRGTIFRMDSDGSVRVLEWKVVTWSVDATEKEGVTTIWGGDYTWMPAFATPDYSETALWGYDNVENFYANKDGIDEIVYGNKKKDACRYLWKNPGSQYDDYTWDDCFDGKYEITSENNTLAFSFLWEPDKEMFKIWDLSFKTNINSSWLFVMKGSDSQGSITSNLKWEDRLKIIFDADCVKEIRNASWKNVFSSWSGASPCFGGSWIVEFLPDFIGHWEMPE